MLFDIFCVNSVGRGSPISIMMLDNRAKPVPFGVLPSSLHRYRNAGGAITDAREFGIDLLAGLEEKQQLRYDTLIQFQSHILSGNGNSNLRHCYFLLILHFVYPLTNFFFLG